MASRFDLEALRSAVRSDPNPLADACLHGVVDDRALHVVAAWDGSEAEFAYVITCAASAAKRGSTTKSPPESRIWYARRRRRAASSRSSIWQRRHVEVFAVDASRTRDTLTVTLSNGRVRAFRPAPSVASAWRPLAHAASTKDAAEAESQAGDAGPTSITATARSRCSLSQVTSGSPSRCATAT